MTKLEEERTGFQDLPAELRQSIIYLAIQPPTDISMDPMQAQEQWKRFGVVPQNPTMPLPDNRSRIQTKNLVGGTVKRNSMTKPRTRIDQADRPRQTPEGDHFPRVGATPFEGGQRRVRFRTLWLHRGRHRTWVGKSFPGFPLGSST